MRPWAPSPKHTVNSSAALVLLFLLHAPELHAIQHQDSHGLKVSRRALKGHGSTFKDCFSTTGWAVILFGKHFNLFFLCCKQVFDYCLINLFILFLLVQPNGMTFFLLIMCLTQKNLHLQTVITSYLHMGATVTIKGMDISGSMAKVSWLVAERTRPWPLFLFHLDPFLSLTRGGFAGLVAGLRGGLL